MYQQSSDEHGLSVLQYLLKKQEPQRADVVSIQELANALGIREVHLDGAIEGLRREYLVEVVEAGRDTQFVFITRRGRNWLRSHT